MSDTLQLLKDLYSFDYQPAPQLRSFGGPLMVIKPDGSALSEEDFEQEVRSLLEGGDGDTHCQMAKKLFAAVKEEHQE